VRQDQLAQFLAYHPTLKADIDAELASRSLYHFVKASWPIVHATEPFVPNWHIQAITDHLQAVVKGDIHNLLIEVAPRMTKSVPTSICLTPWTWLQDPSFTFIYVSFAIHLASDHSTKARRIIESNWYQHYFGDRYKLAYDQNAKLKFANDHTGSREAFGMGGVTGAGAKAVIVDDPSDTKDWTSPTKMKTTIETYDSSIHKRVNNPNDPRRIVIMQRISDKDLAAHLHRQGDWEVITIPMEYDPKRSKVSSIGWKDPRKQPGELLCPRRFSREEAEKEKQRTPRIYSAQYQQAPAADEGAIFKRQNWRHYAEPPQEAVKRMSVVIQSWDLTTGGIDPGTSKVAGQVWGKIAGSENIYLLDSVYEFMDMQQTLDHITAMTLRWPQARAKVIENKAAGPAVITLLKDRLSGIVAWPPQGEKMSDKITRAYAVQPYQEARNLILPDTRYAPWVDEWIELAAAFPEGEYDDTIDAMTQAILYLERAPKSAAPTGVGASARWLR